MRPSPPFQSVDSRRPRRPTRRGAPRGDEHDAKVADAGVADAFVGYASMLQRPSAGD